MSVHLAAALDSAEAGARPVLTADGVPVAQLRHGSGAAAAGMGGGWHTGVWAHFRASPLWLCAALQPSWMAAFGGLLLVQHTRLLLRGLTTNELLNHGRYAYLRDPVTRRFKNPFSAGSPRANWDAFWAASWPLPPLATVGPTLTALLRQPPPVLVWAWAVARSTCGMRERGEKDDGAMDAGTAPAGGLRRGGSGLHAALRAHADWAGGYFRRLLLEARLAVERVLGTVAATTSSRGASLPR
jgi:hypothetical protein